MSLTRLNTTDSVMKMRRKKMAEDGNAHLNKLLMQDLSDLKLTEIAETYQEILDEAARKNSSMLEVLAILVSAEVSKRKERAMKRRIQRAKLPPRKTLEDYDFDFPSQIPKQKIVRLFDCEFVAQHRCAVFIGRTGLGKSHFLNALGYTACEKGIFVRWTRAIDMINVLTAAQINGTLEKKLKEYTRPELLLLDELGYLPIDKRGADLMFQVVAARYECGSMVLTTNRLFREWGKIFDVDNTLATAIIDRLMHHGDAIVIKGKSFRTGESN
jgi:DNA replication protein DnaC